MIIAKTLCICDIRRMQSHYYCLILTFCAAWVTEITKTTYSHTDYLVYSRTRYASILSWV